MVISHGTGGSHLAYRTIAAHLAKSGYVVALLEHPGNNHDNNELSGTVENLTNRPRHVRLAMRSASFPPAMDPEGFDREKFHERLHAELLELLQRTLIGS